MTDIYRSKFAKFIGWLNGSKTGRYAVTTSASCTRYEEDEATVSAEHRAHEDEHKNRIKEMGWINFMATYLWRLSTVGYQHSDLEESARDKESTSTTGA